MPEAPVIGSDPSLMERVRAWLVIVVHVLRRVTSSAARRAVTLFYLLRVRYGWPEMTAKSGLADTRKQVAGVSVKESYFNVPGIRWHTLRVGPSTWTFRVRMQLGQVVEDWDAQTYPLAESARVQIVRARAVRGRPGFVELHFTRCNPLAVVTERPRPLSPACFVVGADEFGQRWEIDFTLLPHWLIAGKTGSGKSVLLRNLLVGIARTDATLVLIDLKFGVEAEIFRHRASEIASSQYDAQGLLHRLNELVESRAGLFRELGVTSIEAAAELGVVLNRVFLVVDEVAELTTPLTEAEATALGLSAKEADALVADITRSLLSLVQRCRAFGIHVILCGQRFGSDQGKGVTSIRAQMAGRICHAVNEVTTAVMALGDGLDGSVHARAVRISKDERGLALVTDGSEWSYARSSWIGDAETRAAVNAFADKATPLDEVATADQAAYDRARGGAS
ncbi:MULTISPECIES: FtsK/SpoIIIE domain-containing protein [unclassified Pseudonocardia]|uniref:FtsK/SpoIIIE domain-containing protein n=1 Tax=unclassified Pseudonocardia TaxID=2619320 RepID=UPI001115369F|nr:FtsK/SpoIIIE domain-containing protein [Pseudonocardia sp. Ae406_Ps2]